MLEVYTRVEFSQPVPLIWPVKIGIAPSKGTYLEILRHAPVEGRFPLDHRITSRIILNYQSQSCV